MGGGGCNTNIIELVKTRFRTVVALHSAETMNKQVQWDCPLHIHITLYDYGFKRKTTCVLCSTT